MTHDGNVYCCWLTMKNYKHATKPAVGSSIGVGEVTHVSLAWFVRRSIAAGKTKRSLRMQQAAILHSV